MAFKKEKLEQLKKLYADPEKRRLIRENSNIIMSNNELKEDIVIYERSSEYNIKKAIENKDINKMIESMTSDLQTSLEEEFNKVFTLYKKRANDDEEAINMLDTLYKEKRYDSEYLYKDLYLFTRQCLAPEKTDSNTLVDLGHLLLLGKIVTPSNTIEQQMDDAYLFYSHAGLQGNVRAITILSSFKKDALGPYDICPPCYVRTKPLSFNNYPRRSMMPNGLYERSQTWWYQKIPNNITVQEIDKNTLQRIDLDSLPEDIQARWYSDVDSLLLLGNTLKDIYPKKSIEMYTKAACLGNLNAMKYLLDKNKSSNFISDQNIDEIFKTSKQLIIQNKSYMRKVTKAFGQFFESQDSYVKAEYWYNLGNNYNELHLMYAQNVAFGYFNEPSKTKKYGIAIGRKLYEKWFEKYLVSYDFLYKTTFPDHRDPYMENDCIIFHRYEGNPYTSQYNRRIGRLVWKMAKKYYEITKVTPSKYYDTGINRAINSLKFYSKTGFNKPFNEPKSLTKSLRYKDIYFPAYMLMDKIEDYLDKKLALDKYGKEMEEIINNNSTR